MIEICGETDGKPGVYRVSSRDNRKGVEPTLLELLNSTIRLQKSIRVQILNPTLEDKTSFTVSIVEIY